MEKWGGDILERLLSREPSKGVHALIIAPHPDDEVIGAGGILKYLRDPFFLYVTDGAPKDMRDAKKAGFHTREGYALARRDESLRALSLSGIKPSNCIEGMIIDQEASFHLRAITLMIKWLVMKLVPEAIITVPYEGGHPDHDSTAFSAHAACRLFEREGIKTPPLIECASYHAGRDGMIVCEFVQDERDTRVKVLDGDERELKGRMFDCFSTQKSVLKYFNVERELFRLAPLYDFTMPPHEGGLFYEGFDWGMKGAVWRELAQETLFYFGINGKI